MKIQKKEPDCKSYFQKKTGPHLRRAAARQSERGMYMKRLMRKPVMLSAALLALIVTAFGAAAIAADGPSKRPGDVNIDRSVDVADAVLLARYVAEDPEAALTRQGTANADLNQDLHIDARDSGVLLEALAGLVHLPETFETTAPEETTTTTEEPGTTSAAETTVTETETEPQQTGEHGHGAEFSGDQVLVVNNEHILPLGSPEAAVLENEGFHADYGELTETLTLRYNTCTMYFHVFAENPANTMIIISRDGTVVGYYTTATECTCGNLYTLTQYVDNHPNGTGQLYAVQALSSSATIQVDSVEDQSDLSVFGKLCYYATNAIRAINGVEPLKWDPALEALASAHSLDMAENNYLDHVDSTGRLPKERIIEAGIKWRSCAENVDGGLRDPFAAVNDWYRSTKGHRDTMLKPDYTNMGAGFAFRAGTRYGVYGTQDYIKAPS